VDDVCQEVFVTVHRRLSDFEGRSSLRTWVYGICVRTASDYRKRVRSRREVSSEVGPEPAVSPGQEYAVSIRQARTALDRILDGLDEDKRAVFVLYEIEELPMADVAGILGCPLQTAYSRLHVARGEVEQAVERLRAGEELRAS
jgi:RNA polymerase sigma-70 factor (ECF subfamily)